MKRSREQIESYENMKNMSLYGVREGYNLYIFFTIFSQLQFYFPFTIPTLILRNSIFFILSSAYLGGITLHI